MWLTHVCQELARRREMARKEADFEIKRARHERKIEKVRAKDAMERELERRNQLEQQVAKTQAILSNQVKLAEDSRDRMEEKSRMVQEAIERKKDAKHLEIEEQRIKAELRIKQVTDANKKIQLDKRAVYDQKQLDIEVAKKEKAEEDRLKTIKLSASREEKHHRQKMKKDEAMARLEERKMRIQQQLDNREQFIHVIEEERAEERAKANLMAELAHSDKRQNVQRIQRMNEFMRLQTMHKIENDDSRTELIKEQKTHLLEERRQMAHENFLRKSWVKEAMDQMKVSNKFVDIEEIIRKKSGGKAGGGGEENDDADFYN